MNRITVDGFFVDPTSNEFTLTAPADFADFQINDGVLVYREDTIVCRGLIVDIITRASNGHKHLVLSGVNRRSVKQGDTLESLRNSPVRFEQVTEQTTAY